MHDNFGMVDTGKTSRKTGEPVMKPKPVLDCNKGMWWCWGSVDTMDQQCSSYPFMCCSLKAYKIFFCLFYVTLFNAYIMYKKKISRNLKYNHFKLVIIEELLVGLITPAYAR